jgi:hypothetical protein
MSKPYRAGVLVLAFSGIAAAQVAVLQIQITEGDGAVYAPGSRSTRPLAVQVTDETGQPVAGATVSFLFPEQGPSGIFSNGLRTELAKTDSSGRASVRNFQLTRIGGAFSIRITAIKDQARAGTVASQYISETAAPAARQILRKPGRKRMLIAIAIGAGVAGAAVLASSRGGSNTPGAGSSPPPLSIGTPTITIGRP